MKSSGPTKGRGALSSPDPRYLDTTRESFDDGWTPEEQGPAPATILTVDASRTVLSRNDSPDLPFDRSVNPYRGCEHGCIYCYARPSHAWLDLSPGLDFETRLFYKPDCVAQLEAEIAARSYRCAPIAVGVNTDAYQPVERRLELMRGLLKLMLERRHPVQLITKSALIERDLDLLAELARHGLVQVAVSITTLDRDLARRLEPRAAAPQRRLLTLERLTQAGVPTLAMVAPVIPALTDHELESILTEARAAGAGDAQYVLLRLPHEVEALFQEWLAEHAPLRAARVMSLLRESRGGKSYDGRFGARMRGEGVHAQLLGRRFAVAHRRLGFPGNAPMTCEQFRGSGQLDLFS